MAQTWIASFATPPPPFTITSSSTVRQNAMASALVSWTRLASQLQVQALSGPVDPTILNILGAAMVSVASAGGDITNLVACIQAADEQIRWCGIGTP